MKDERDREREERWREEIRGQEGREEQDSLARNKICLC